MGAEGEEARAPAGRSSVPVRDGAGRALTRRFAVDPAALSLVRWNGSTYLYDAGSGEYREAVVVELMESEVKSP